MILPWPLARRWGSAARVSATTGASSRSTACWIASSETSAAPPGGGPPPFSTRMSSPPYVVTRGLGRMLQGRVVVDIADDRGGS